MAKSGDGKSFREKFSEAQNTPEAREQQRRQKYKVLAFLVAGLPFALVVCLFCRWMDYSPSYYLPIAAACMILLSNMLAAYLYERAVRTER